MNAMNPDVEVVTYHEWINSTNITDIIKDKDYDFIIDGTDNFPIKFLINDACVMLGKPFSHAGIIRFQGQLLTYVPKEPTGSKGPCYRCVFRNPPPPDAVPTCRQAGVLGVMGGVIGTLQATEALKYLLGMDGLLNGCLLTYNAITMEFRKVKIAHNPGCQVCGEKPTITTLIDYEQAVCDLREYHNTPEVK
jgi:molybdopterin/thiamine biosynthesis adenylyltransferase